MSYKRSPRLPGSKPSDRLRLLRISVLRAGPDVILRMRVRKTGQTILLTLPEESADAAGLLLSALARSDPADDATTETFLRGTVEIK